MGLPLLLACGSNPPCIDGAAVWDSPPTGPFCVRDDLLIAGRTQDELRTLDELEEIEGSLYIEGNPELSVLPALPALVRIGGSLAISNNAKLTHVYSFSALEQLGGGVYVGENPNLAAFEFSERLTTIGSLFFALNPRLVELRGGLHRVEGNFGVAENTMLNVLEMPMLTEVVGNFHVTANPALRVLDFPILKIVAGGWEISENNALETLAGFPKLLDAVEARITANGALRELVLTSPFGTSLLIISENERLERIEGAGDVRLTDKTLVFVTSNPTLQSIEGFSGVAALESLAIQNNKGLRKISGFTALSRITSDLQILENHALVGPTDWFSALVDVSDLWIYQNSSLPSSAVDALLTHVTVRGATKVGDNQGQDTALDPCPWPNDHVCDAVSMSKPGTGLCTSDPEDCGD